MARDNYIQSVLDAAKGRPYSQDWYRDKIKEFGTPKTLDLIRDGKRSSRPFFGRLNMFVYGPKHAKNYLTTIRFLWCFLWRDIVMGFWA